MSKIEDVKHEVDQRMPSSPPPEPTMTDASRPRLTPADRVDDIPAVLRALRIAVQKALRRHKLAGNPVAVWEDGKVVWIPAADIPEQSDSET